MAVHAIVAVAYLPPKPSVEHEIRHLNGDKRDNRACNLTWGTAQDNADDRERHGRTARGVNSGSIRHPDSLHRGDQHHSRLHPERLARGEHNGSARFSTAEIQEIRKLRDAGRTLLDIANSFQTGKSTIYSIVTRKTWAHIPEVSA